MWRPPGVMFLNGPRSALIAWVIPRTTAKVVKNDAAENSWRSLRRSSKCLQYSSCSSRVDRIPRTIAVQLACETLQVLVQRLTPHQLFVEMVARCTWIAHYRLDQVGRAYGRGLRA